MTGSLCIRSERIVLSRGTLSHAPRHSLAGSLPQRCGARSIGLHQGSCTTPLRASEKEEPSSGSDSTESLFAKELQKRGLNTASRDEGDGGRSASTSTSTQQPPSQARKEKGSSQPAPAPRFSSQLEKSRALGSEGFEGILPRLTELGKLGLTFFLAFGPLVLITLVLFGGLFALFGEEFIHGGRHFSGIPYVNPYDLLEEPTQDPMIPFR